MVSEHWGLERLEAFPVGVPLASGDQNPGSAILTVAVPALLALDHVFGQCVRPALPNCAVLRSSAAPAAPRAPASAAGSAAERPARRTLTPQEEEIAVGVGTSIADVERRSRHGHLLG